jgi:hypothetical protein
MALNMHYAVVNTENNIVENLIVLEEGAIWAPPHGRIVIPYVKSVSPGDTWDGTNFIAQTPPPPVSVEAISVGVQNVIG